MEFMCQFMCRFASHINTIYFISWNERIYKFFLDRFQFSSILSTKHMEFMCQITYRFASNINTNILIHFIERKNIESTRHHLIILINSLIHNFRIEIFLRCVINRQFHYPLWNSNGTFHNIVILTHRVPL